MKQILVQTVRKDSEKIMITDKIFPQAMSQVPRLSEHLANAARAY